MVESSRGIRDGILEVGEVSVAIAIHHFEGSQDAAPLGFTEKKLLPIPEPKEIPRDLFPLELVLIRPLADVFVALEAQ